MTKIVTGDQYERLDGKLFEIKRQIRQKGGYPYDLNQLDVALQAVVEGRFESFAIPNETVKPSSSNFYTLLSDKKAVNWLMKHAGKTNGEARQIVNAFRRMARWDGVPNNVLIHADVLPGCLFKRDIPKMGPCYDEFKYLQDWTFPDPPTERCLVSWTSAPISGSTSKTYAEQVKFLAERKADSGLPEGYGLTPGSVGHIGGMALAHFKTTGKDPFNGLVAPTNICDEVGFRLHLRWHEGSLRCGYWSWEGSHYSHVAVFGLGVVRAIGPSGARPSR